MSEMGSSLNRILGPLRRYYGHSPRFERLVNRAVWSLTTPWSRIGSAAEKIRLLEKVRPYTLVHGWGIVEGLRALPPNGETKNPRSLRRMWRVERRVRRRHGPLGREDHSATIAVAV